MSPKQSMAAPRTRQRRAAHPEREDPQAPFRRLRAAFESLVAPTTEGANFSGLTDRLGPLVGRIDDIGSLDPYFLSRALLLFLMAQEGMLPGQESKGAESKGAEVKSLSVNTRQGLLDPVEAFLSDQARRATPSFILPIFEPPQKVRNAKDINIIEALLSYYQRVKSNIEKSAPQALVIPTATANVV